MQYGFSIKRKCYLLSVLLMTVWLTGCVQEEFESTPSPAGNGIRFTLTVPDVNLPSVSSRTMTGTGTAKKEDEIETVDILVLICQNAGSISGMGQRYRSYAGFG